MDDESKVIHETTIEARDGVNVPGMTTVVIVSTLLAVVVLGAIWLLGL